MQLSFWDALSRRATPWCLLSPPLRASLTPTSVPPSSTPWDAARENLRPSTASRHDDSPSGGEGFLSLEEGLLDDCRRVGSDGTTGETAEDEEEQEERIEEYNRDYDSDDDDDSNDSHDINFDDDCISRRLVREWLLGASVVDLAALLGLDGSPSRPATPTVPIPTRNIFPAPRGSAHRASHLDLSSSWASKPGSL